MSKKIGKSSPDTKDTAQLKIAVAALQGSQHNPIYWGAVVRLVAPIIARLAARFAARYVANKLNRRLGNKIPREVADATADRIAAVVLKMTFPK